MKILVDIPKVVQLMTNEYGYDPRKGMDGYGYSYALLDALEDVHCLETEISKELEKIKCSSS